jgi:hypothetical protein
MKVEETTLSIDKREYCKGVTALLKLLISLPPEDLGDLQNDLYIFYDIARTIQENE